MKVRGDFLGPPRISFKEFNNCFLTKFILVLLSKNKLEIKYSICCLLYHITYKTMQALLYQPLRFILVI